MILKDQKLIDKNIVRIDNLLLQDFPLVSLTEENLIFAPGYHFSSLTYVRPSGASHKGSAVVEVINNSGDILVKEIELEFAFSEAERLQDARKVESFSIRPEALMKRDPSTIETSDVEHKYEDIKISKVQFSDKPFAIGKKATIKKTSVKSLDTDYGYLLVTYGFIRKEKNSNSLTSEKIQLPIDRISDFDLVEDTNEQRSQIGILKTQDEEVKKKLSKTVEELSRFQIKPNFLNGAPPIDVNLSILIPGMGVKFRKVNYYPPKTIDDKKAYLQVEYYFKDRIYNERVKFMFSKTIRESVVALIKRVQLSDFKFLSESRIAPPTFLTSEDFRYEGRVPGVEITDVIYNYDEVGNDKRHIMPELVVTYRTVDLIVRKKLEFKYSKNEYIEGKWRFATTENGSVEFPKIFTDPVAIYKLFKGDIKLKKELMRGSKIVEGYSYDYVKKIEVVNFEKDSDYAVFKIIAQETYGNQKLDRVFEKWVEMRCSYQEAILQELNSNDVGIVKKDLPNFPPKTINDSYFVIDDMFKILSIQYNRPEDDEKIVQVELKIGVDKKSIFIVKELKFKYSKKEYNNLIWKSDVQEYLHRIDPASITVDVDLNGSPVEKITNDMIIGLPTEVEYSVDYKPPKYGKRDTRMVLKIWKGNMRVSFEQTLVFKDPR